MKGKPESVDTSFLSAGRRNLNYQQILAKLGIVFFFLSATFYLIVLPFIVYPINSILKPVPIFLLILITWITTSDNTTKILLITALVFSLIGDIVLTFPNTWAFKLGILFFLLAHCVYISLYFKDAQLKRNRTVYFLPVLLFIVASYWFMFPFLGQMTIPVTIYLCFLTLMVFTAFQVKQYPVLISAGASLFLLSDFILALTQFVFVNTPITTFLIMLTYYVAQFFLVLGISKRK